MDEPSRPPRAPPRELFVERPGGVQLVAHVHGPASAPPELRPILILDGIGCAGWAFGNIIPRLAADREVALMFYRGHGACPTPPRPWRLAMNDLADDAAAVLAELGGGPAVVVGFSMGFQVALELYRRHPSTVAGMVSIAGPSGRVLAQFQGTELFAHALPFIRAATSFGRSLFHDAWTRVLPSRFARAVGLRTQVNAHAIDEDAFELYLRQMSEMNPELFLHLLHEAHEHDATDLLHRVDVPALVIAGARDRFVPLAKMRDIAEQIPGAQWEVLPEATHALPAEFPDEVVEQLRRFVDPDAR